MKNNMYYIGMIAIIMTASMFESCSSDEMVEEMFPTQQEQIVTLVTTLSPKDGDKMTRALTDPGTGIITSEWTVDEELLVMYTDNDGADKTAKATVTSVDADGKATIIVDLVNPKQGESDIFFNYPYSSASGERDAYTDQIGTLADISLNYDDATGQGTLNVSGSTATLPSGVLMTKHACIWKFTFTDGSSDITNSVTSLSIDTGGGMPYQIAPPSGAKDAIYVAMYGTDNANITITASTTSGIYSISKAGITLTNGKLYTSKSLRLNNISNIVNLASQTDSYIAQNGDILTGTLGSSVKISIADGATVMLKDATINRTYSDKTKYAGLTCLGDATIILSGTSHIKGFHQIYPGIQVAESSSKTLTIQGDGTLTAEGQWRGAGIGGAERVDCGNIVIKSGNITAIGHDPGAGIGSGGFANCGDITICGGTVVASSQTVGIGASCGYSASEKASCGNITITGGNITATAGSTSSQGINGAGIGCGQQSVCGDITISGGTVSSIAYGVNSAGIGSTYSGSCGNITITRDVTHVTATKAKWASNSIGAGMSGGCGTVTIEDPSKVTQN